MRKECRTGRAGAALLLVAAAHVLMSCGGAARSGKVPLGVSPRIAARADSIAARLFVSTERERKANAHRKEGIRNYLVSDSLWAQLDARKREAAAHDSIARQTSIPHKAEANGSSQTPATPVDAKTQIRATFNLMEARRNLRKSLHYHAFNPQAKHYLALTYKLLAERFPHAGSFVKAAEQWEELSRLEPGEYLHCYNLGATYFEMRDWALALQRYARAETLMLAAAEVSPARLENPDLAPAAAIDSTRLFFTVYYQGQSAIKLEMATAALRHLERARTLTGNSLILNNISQDIKWINWDGGNIRASLMRDSANAQIARGKYLEVCKLYEEMLSGVLRTKRAQDYIIWDYATIEYARLKRRVSAIARLDEAMQSIARDETGAPLDSTYRTAFDSYGAMCYYLGKDTASVNRRVGYNYLERAARIACKDRGRIYIEMAELSKSNPEISVQNAERALELVQAFDNYELKRLYDLLVEGYRHKNLPVKAREFFEKRKALP